MGKRTLTFALAGAAALTSVLVASGSAEAGTTGRCYTGDACFYYNSNHDGAVAPTGGPQGGAIVDLAGIDFNAGTGAGSGQPVKNNAASAENDTSWYFFSFYNSEFEGSYDVISPMNWANLQATYNEDASTCFDYTSARPSFAECVNEEGG